MKGPLMLVLIVLLSTSGCVSTVTQESIQIAPRVLESHNQYEKEYVLSPGDEIEVLVYRHPDFSTTGMVRPDGCISIPVLDDVKAAGMTPKALDDYLTNRLSAERLVDPEVTVIVKNTREPMVYVFGEVARPGPISLRTTRTAAHAIANAGGMKSSAAKDTVALIRLNQAGKLVAHIIEAQFEGQPSYYMALQAMRLQQDDLIIVPESNRAQFVRLINDFITTPFGALNQLLTPYYQFRLLEIVDD